MEQMLTLVPSTTDKTESIHSSIPKPLYINISVLVKFAKSFGFGSKVWASAPSAILPDVEDEHDYAGVEEDTDHSHDGETEEEHAVHSHDKKASEESLDNVSTEVADEDHNHDHGEFDPHVWLSLDLAVIQATNIKNAIIEVDPENTDYYKANFESLVNDLTSLKDEYTEKFRTLEKKNL